MNSFLCIALFLYNFYRCNGQEFPNKLKSLTSRNNQENVPISLNTLKYGKTNENFGNQAKNIPVTLNTVNVATNGGKFQDIPKTVNVGAKGARASEKLTTLNTDVDNLRNVPKGLDDLAANKLYLPITTAAAAVSAKNIPETFTRVGNAANNKGNNNIPSTLKTLNDLSANGDIIPKTLLTLNDIADNKKNISESDINLNSHTITAKDISAAFLTMVKLYGEEESKRITELNDKLSKIDSYVPDRESYAQLLLNETKRNDLNATNFFSALLEQDHFRFMNDTRNLYLKLKEKMNRDDLLKILSERGEKNVMISARRMMGETHIANKLLERQIDEAVDKYLGETPNDNHSFSGESPYNHIWDPKLEIEDRLEKRKQGGRRIFRGERTTVRYYPFVVSIHVMGRFWCGGAIYASDLVVTSASCLQLMHNNRFFRENPRALAVRVGSNHSRVGGEVIEALEVYFHPGYNPRTLKCNIAVIRLVRRLRFNHHRIPKIIRLTTNEQGLAFTARVLLLGWGVTKTSQKMAFEPIFLQSKELPVYPNKFCQEVYGDKFVTETMFCAGTMTTGEGACDHDAGGPAVLAGKLVGIISFGPAICGFPDAPTVFTLVGAYTDWIETVNETMPGYYRGRMKTTTTTEDPLFEYFAEATRYLATAKEAESTTSTLSVVESVVEAITLADIESLTNTSLVTLDLSTHNIIRSGNSDFKLYPLDRVGRHKLTKHKKKAKKQHRKENENVNSAVEDVNW